MVLASLAYGVHAQHQHQPYSRQQARDIKSLSDEEVKQYLSGAGMGFARSAELNRYPGPMHVLEASARLQGEYRLAHLETHRRMRALLTDEQVQRYDALRGYK